MSDVNFEVALDKTGYRKVLTRLAYERLRFAVPVLAVVGLYSSSTGSSGGALLSFAALLGLPIAIWGLVSWQVYRPGRTPIYEPMQYSVAEEGLVYGPADSLRIVECSDFKRWREAAGHVLLFVTGSQYVLVPTDPLSGETRDAFLFDLTRHLGTPKDRSLIGRFRRRRR